MGTFTDTSEIATLRRAVRHLQDRLAEAEETIAQLRDCLAVQAPLPAWLPHLTASEQRVLRMLMTGSVVTIEKYSAAIDHRSGHPENLVRVLVFRLRSKLEPYGIEILTERDRGYVMPRSSIELLTAPVTAPPAMVVVGQARPDRH